MIVFNNLLASFVQIASFLPTFRLRPDLATAHFNFAATLEESGQLERARQEYKLYLQYAPNASDAEQVRAHLKKLGAAAH